MAARRGTDPEVRQSFTRVELDELSGPVSPRYQYRTHIVVVKGKAGTTLSYDHEGVFAAGKPTETRKAKVTLTPDAEEALEVVLASLAESAAVPEEIKDRVGVAVSTLTVTRGRKKTALEYTRPELKRAAGAKKRALVEAVKAWAEALIE